MKMRIAGLVQESIVDGPGFRMAVFAQGCPHGCPHCHNPQTHDFLAGREIDTSEIIRKMCANSLLDGLTLTGGEPFCQPEPCTELATAARQNGLNVWCYTGYTFEELLQMHNSSQMKLLNQVDILVDGRFDWDLRTFECRFRGSSNQRLLDVPRSLTENRAIEAEI